VIPPDGLAQFVRSGGPAEDELDVLAREIDDPFVLEEIIRSRSTSDETLLHLARTATGRPQEALIANHARLLGEPQIIRTLLENPSLSSEGRRLLAELKEEFFEKSSRLREAEEDGTEGEESATRRRTISATRAISKKPGKTVRRRLPRRLTTNTLSSSALSTGGSG
jgi:hypothetical protein